MRKKYGKCSACGKVIWRKETKNCRKCASKKRIKTLENNFWPNIRKTDSCWIWTGGILQSGGYGYVTYLGNDFRAHRLSWILHKGEIPKGFEVCHKCDNPPCVNPAHLFLGTHNDNMRDMKQKKRCALGERHGLHKLTTEQVKKIRSEYVRGIITHKMLGEIYGVDRHTIGDIINKKYWTHI